MSSKWNVRLTILVVVFVLAAILVQSAGAGGNFSFKSTNFTLGSMVFNGFLVGTANEGVEATLTGYGTVKAWCQNKGGNLAPGRNSIQASVQQTNQFTTDQNGNATVDMTAHDPTLASFNPSPTPKEAGCPNGNWNVVGIVEGSTNWTAANVLVKDISGEVRLDLWFDCETIFTNGVATSLTCWES